MIAAIENMIPFLLGTLFGVSITGLGIIIFLRWYGDKQ